MKKRILIAFTKRDNRIIKISGLFLCIVLSLNLSGQGVHTLLSETWVSGNWQNSFLQTSTYDGSNHLINTLAQNWDVPSVSWLNSTQANYTNNPDGTTDVVINQSWDGVSAWYDFTKTTYTYNASKKVLTSVTEVWLIAIWQNSTRQTNTYDGSGFLTNSLTQRWDEISSSWKNFFQINYTNNSDGNPTQEINQLWDGVSAWVNSQRSTLTYNTDKKFLTDVSDGWVNGSWQPQTMETNTYDVNGNLTSTLYQVWDEDLVSWENDGRNNYVNNPNGSPSVITIQNWDGISAFINTDRTTYTYSSPTLNRELRGEEKFNIYPNPAADFIKIEANKSIHGLTYSITDQAGKQVLTGKLTDLSNRIDISTLPNGIYFLHSGETIQHTYKIIKNKY